ncbi:MFS transporter [Priestia taiwanensis]|uniref:MFS transporter n=1 Tax=Priestia taiwanensis TaxID=1347902 RepID=A0A917AIK1_9BACI|nr:MFS transporter [Priestia taiwanensis]MBM7361521.1 putative MFS family arabinose efflux permease [Priestia taiwanensis]GGE54829.1 MFS transporter [Priestia taiwanensis]
MINRSFVAMWLSSLSAILSGRLKELVIPLLVLGMTSSPLAAGLVVLSQQLGVILFSMPLGTWMEERNKWRVAVVTKGLTALCMFVLSFGVFQEALSSLSIAFLLFVLGILGLMTNTAFHVMIPAVAGRKNLVDAHTNLEGADAISTFVGPMLAGMLLVYIGDASTLFVCGVLALLSMVFMYGMKYEEKRSDRRTETKRSFFSRVREGFAYLFINKYQSICTVCVCVLSFITVFVSLTIVIHAEQTLSLSPQFIGIVLSCAGIGNIIGIFLLKKFNNPSWIPFLSMLLFVSGFGVFLMVVTDMFWLVCVGMLVFDGALSMAFVIHASVHQGITPDEVLARMRSATYVLGGVCGMLGSFLAGVLSQYFSSTVALSVGVGVLLLAGLYVVIYRDDSVVMKEIEPMYVE